MIQIHARIADVKEAVQNATGIDLPGGGDGGKKGRSGNDGEDVEGGKNKSRFGNWAPKQRRAAKHTEPLEKPHPEETTGGCVRACMCLRAGRQVCVWAGGGGAGMLHCVWGREEWRGGARWRLETCLDCGARGGVVG